MSSSANDGSSHISVENDSWRSEFEIEGDTYSIDSSITAYRMENGRRYHAYREGVYWAPNDERQNENLDISHHKFLLLLDGKLFLAPIPKDVKRVLDLGTGTGIWAIDFADEYPDASILGIDLSPIQPTMVPPNCRFEIDDAADKFTYPPDHFDFIHVRGLYGSISDWATLYSQIFRHTAPEGWVEQVEISIDFRSDDGTIKPDSPLLKLTELFTEAGEVSGQTFRTFEIMKESLQTAGFVNVVEKIFKSPIGSWPSNPKMKELGRWGLLGLDVGLEGYTMAPLTRLLGWNPNEVQVLLAQVRAALRDRRVHPYHEIRVVYGQKPGSSSSSDPSPSTEAGPSSS